MKINQNKSIGRVLFIVEGGRTEFSLLKKIFCNVLGYEYIEKRRGNADFYKNKITSTSRIAVINTEESNIQYIQDENSYLDNVFKVLITDYDFPIDNCAIYFIFDRDPRSNTNAVLIEKLINQLRNAYENEDGNRGGLLLLSYPSIEGYIVEKFIDDTYLQEFALGNEVKMFIAGNPSIQLNKICEDTIIKASVEMMKYLNAESIEFNIDDIGCMNMEVFKKQESHYSITKLYSLLSLLSVAFIDLGIIELD